MRRQRNKLIFGVLRGRLEGLLHTANCHLDQGSQVRDDGRRDFRPRLDRLRLRGRGLREDPRPHRHDHRLRANRFDVRLVARHPHSMSRS